MSAQNPTIPTATQAKGIDAVVLDLQTHLDFDLVWLTNGMGRAYRLTKVRANQSVVFIPEVYLGTNQFKYFAATPDNDKKGQSIFIVGNEGYPNQQLGFYGLLEYDVSIIFAVNLKLIDPTLLETEYFEEHQIEDVRESLIRNLLGKSYKLEVNEVVRQFEDVYNEFDVSNDRGIAHAPMSYFRFNCTVTIREDCAGVSLNRCGSITQNLSENDKNDCILPTYDFSDTIVQDAITPGQESQLTDWLCPGAGYQNSYSMYFDGAGELISYPINAAYDLEYTDSFTFTARINIDSLHNGVILGKYKTAGFGWYWRVATDGTLQFTIARGSSQKIFVASTTILAVGTTYHVAACFGGSGAASVDLYINSILETPDIRQDNITGSIINTNNLYSGAFVGGNFFHGTQNVPRIWNGIKFNQTQIDDDYNSNVPKEAGESGFLVLANDMGDGAIFGVDTFCFPDTSGTVTGGQSSLMEYDSKVTSI